jgi:glycosyltransferase involved in cell wall biosynthesis
MKLSIITINRNNTNGLEKTIQSVVCQKFIDYEYIVIDGNSTDGSVEIIKKYANHIHYWISEQDSGIYNAMNKGIQKATGEYVIFMNSGDCLMNENTLTNVFVKERSADLLAGNLIKKWRKMEEKRIIFSPVTFYHFILGEATPHHQATFIKRTLFDEIGLYDEELKISSDWKFFLLAIFKYNKSVDILDEYIASMDTNGLSNSKKFFCYIEKEHDETLRKYFPRFLDDYKELYRLKRFTFHRLKRHIKWRLRFLLHG